MDEIINAISTVGFPIVAAIYLVIIGRKTIQENTRAVMKLSSSLDKNTTTIENLLTWNGVERRKK